MCNRSLYSRITQLVVGVQVDQGCDVTVQLYLKETRCHVIDPTDFEECPERGLGERVSSQRRPRGG